jgi:hypothetical protein
MAGLAGAVQPALDPEPERAHRLGVSDVPVVEPRNDGLELRLRLLLSSGGDERIWPDPLTGRSRQGTTIAPAPDEAWFSSSTASTITEQGYRAALADLQSLLRRGVRTSVQVQDWLRDLRAELLALYGRAGAEAVLAASGTDAELIALAIAERLLARPITNIVVAPSETGSGVPKAAAGLHFLATSCLGGPVTIGQRLNGWGGADIDVECVDIRTPDGAPRDPGAVDLDVACHAERALARGRGVLLHVLDTSKTGLAGPSREAAAKIAALAPERVHVLVDACQLRCPADRLRSDLDRGFMVLITGSKFAGGPPLSGALLLPEAVATGLRSAPLPPEGLADYSARLDWPEHLQTTFAREMTTTANLGVGLRWTAAVAELRRFAIVDRRLQERFLDRFEREVRLRAGTTPRVALLRDSEHRVATNPSIVPLAVRRAGGGFMSASEAAKVQVALRTAIANAGMQGAAARLRRIMHVGQPVQLGPRAVLRVCASAPQINSVAAQVAQGAAFDDAFAPISRDLQALFAKLGDVLSGECA